MHETSIEEAKNYIGHINLSLPYGIDPTREINTFLANPNEYIRQIYLKDYLIINLLSRCKELEKSQIKCPTCATCPKCPTYLPITPATSVPIAPTIVPAVVPAVVPIKSKCKIDRNKLKPLLEEVTKMQEQIKGLKKQVDEYEKQVKTDVTEEINKLCK